MCRRIALGLGLALAWTLAAVQMVSVPAHDASSATDVEADALAGPSRVHSGIRDDLLYVISIVDASALTGRTWQQIADYLAVVSLAQIDPSTDPQEFDSILNLFSHPTAYSGLTDWDRNYLRALYTFDPERVVRIQGNEIVSRIAKRELTDAQ